MFISRKSEAALVDEFKTVIAEVKRQSKKYNPNQLLSKPEHLLAKLNIKDYTVEQRCFSLDNLEEVMDEFAGK